MAQKGRYKETSPEEAASEMLLNLINKIPEMKEHYPEGLDRFASDAKAQMNYLVGVSAHIAAMRQPEVRSAIRNAVNTAKNRADMIREQIKQRVEQLQRRILGVAPRAAPTIPAT